MALKPLNSVGGFSVGETPSNVIYPNGDFSGNKANFSGNIAALGLLTNNLYYANGSPWDLQEAAGSNGYVQFNDNNNFAASANFVFDSSTSVLTVTGNANVTNTLLAGNVRTDNLLYANGNPWDLQEAAGANTQIQYNIGNDFAASANLTYNDTTQQFTVLGNGQFNNANLGNLAIANFAEITSNIIANNVTSNLLLTANVANVTGNATFGGAQVTIDNELSGNTANFTGNITALNFIGNISGNLTISAPNTSVIYSSNGAAVGSNNFTWDYASNVLTVDGTANITGNTKVGGILTDNYYYSNGAPVDFQQAAGSNNEIQFNSNDDFAASANLTFDPATSTLTVTGNANITTVNTSNVVGGGTDVTINANGYVSTFNGANGLVDLPGALTANGNLTVLNAALGNLATANYINVANDLNVVGNVNAGNLVGTFANGNSNVKVYSNANVEISVAGNANVVTVTGAGLLVAGNIQATSGSMLANGNVTANGFLVGANASVTGDANVGSLTTANITATSQNISINAGANGTVSLIPNGSGTVDVNMFRITQVGTPTDALDATNKEYVDALAGEGLVIHTPVRVESPSALTATYAQGGTTPTVTDIVNGTDIVFSASHGLSVNDGIVFANTFNGLTGGEAYWVYSVANTTAITVKDGYFGTQVTGLTNGTGLTQGSRANPGVGATLTNAGANAALTIDGIALANNDRVLIYTQSNAFENGIYDVTDSGNGSAQWVLTRSTDFDKYIPGSSSGLGKGSYVFVTEGLTGAGESYVMTAPAGEVIIGTDGVTFTQFSAAGSYSAGNGINITGSIISANVDGVTTDIVSGNIVVKTSANLTTPNIGDATFSSLTWNTLSNGNVTANNLSISNIANITLDLTVGGNIQANGTISANANVSGLNLTTNGNVTATGDVVANNVTGNTLLTVPTANVSNIVNAGNVTITNELSGNTANFSGAAITNALTVNTEIAGNTANFSGNVIVPNLTVNLELAGNTANFSGNITALNVNGGNLVTANFFTGTLVNGNSNVVVSANGNVSLTAAGNTSLVVTGTGANVAGTLDVTGNLTAGNLAVTSVTANTVTANTSVDIGNTEIGWGTVTTSAITANQTIAQFSVSGVTGVEFIVKGEDSAGSKYSVATVTAVTDGSQVDYVTYATAVLGATTGTLAVNINAGNLALQVTPSSSNTTVWTAQYRTI